MFDTSYTFKHEKQTSALQNSFWLILPLPCGLTVEKGFTDDRSLRCL
ncbi:MAG: hypothetical protein LBU65_11330 [Planctomycetaceae bacterium]|nr:hypothetical protein [Planctomycetaceae bacterium]